MEINNTIVTKMGWIVDLDKEVQPQDPHNFLQILEIIIIINNIRKDKLAYRNITISFILKSKKPKIVVLSENISSSSSFKPTTWKEEDFGNHLKITPLLIIFQP